MGYALFAQRKLVLDMQLNTAQLMQTQRSNEQFALATEHNNLSQELSSYEAAQAGDLAELYNQLVSSDSSSRDDIQNEIEKMKLQQKQDKKIHKIKESIKNHLYISRK